MLEKFREAALAYKLEKHWSKEKILTEYLNTIYFGEGAYGIEAAAQTYFGAAHPGCGDRSRTLRRGARALGGGDDRRDHRLALGLRPQGQPGRRAGAPQPGAGKDGRTGLHHPRPVRRRHPQGAPRPGRHQAADAGVEAPPTSPPSCASSWSNATAPRRPTSAASKSTRRSTCSSRKRPKKRSAPTSATRPRPPRSSSSTTTPAGSRRWSAARTSKRRPSTWRPRDGASRAPRSSPSRC